MLMKVYSYSAALNQSVVLDYSSLLASCQMPPKRILYSFTIANMLVQGNKIRDIQSISPKISIPNSFF